MSMTQNIETQNIKHNISKTQTIEVAAYRYHKISMGQNIENAAYRIAKYRRGSKYRRCVISNRNILNTWNIEGQNIKSKISKGQNIEVEKYRRQNAEVAKYRKQNIEHQKMNKNFKKTSNFKKKLPKQTADPLWQAYIQLMPNQSI